MERGTRSRALGVFLALLAAPAAAAELQVVQSGPQGEVAQLGEAAEVRVVFSEPMVALGRIPDRVEAPFFSIAPSVPGTLRWSGTRTLIFTPDAPDELPYATRFRVTVEAGATAVSGRRLAAPHAFEFTTPTVRLLRVNWQREGGRFDAPLFLYLRFNQPVSRQSLLPHLSFAYAPHDWTPPELPAEASERDPRAASDFAAKVARTQAAVKSRAAVAVAAAPSWDRQTFPPAPDLVVLETRVAPPPDAWIAVTVGPRVPSAQGAETPGQPQSYTVKLEPTFFVQGFRCREACDPEGWNPLRLRGRVVPRVLGSTLAVADVTASPATPLEPAARSPEHEEEPGYEYPTEGDEYDAATEVALEDVGYRLAPARRYRVTVGRGLVAKDGQTLGYTWAGTVDNWHQRAFTSFGGGHGVWESSGGSKLPFYARNLRAVTQWLRPLSLDELMPTTRRLQEKYFRLAPEEAPVERALGGRPDTIESHGLELRPFLSPQNTGLLWAALRDGDPIPRAHESDTARPPRSTLVQVTNLGLSVKDSPHDTLVLVTRLDDGQPVAGAKVAIRDLDNAVRFTATTDASGVATMKGTDLRIPDEWWRFRFMVTAEKDGDAAFVGSDWYEGIEPWSFSVNYDLGESRPLLRGSVFADRGVYKLGEEVHLKAILRTDTAEGVALLPAGTAVEVVVRDTHGDEVVKTTLALSEWSSAEWAFTLPRAAPLGYYDVAATVKGQERSARGSFLVAAYRRPEFRVEVGLAGESSLAGVSLAGVVDGRYLFGGAMAGAPVRWTYARSPSYTVPAAISDRYPAERWAFLDHERPTPPSGTIETKEEELDGQGRLSLTLETSKDAGVPYEYTLEGEVTDVSRQRQAGRNSFRVDPAPWYVGLKRPPYFADAALGLDTEVVAVSLEGSPVPGVEVTLSLTQVQWHSVRRAEGGGFYTWETERREVAAGEFQVATAETPQALHVPMPAGGYFVLRAVARDAEGRSTTTAVSFYGLGPGYTAWAREDHNRIELVPERKTYRPGDTARIMVKSPWEKATALLTTEREGVRSHRVFALSSTQETVTVPITEADIPNVYVSVLLVKGRTEGYTGEDQSDPGKPSFRLGYAELTVEDAAKRLAVAVATDREEYRPAARAHVEVTVTDPRGQPASAEVTLWAVDVGVLALTGHRTPDVGEAVWVEKALQVLNTDSRQRIIGRRALVPKGGEEGGGGGADEGPGSSVRRDFRVLAFWLGSVVTDRRGKASADVALPESLSAYRVMAVAADRQSRFGRGERELRISKPVMLRAAFPRFLARGDAATFGAVVNNQLKEKGTALVTMRSLDPAVLEVEGEARQALEVAAGGAVEARFRLRARAVGEARVRMTVKLAGESDAFEEVLPVRLLVSPEVVAAYGQARPSAVETLALPAGVLPGQGGLHLEMSSTALVGLGEGARYLVEYPYGCAEQRASAALGLVLAADLGDSFRLPGMDTARMKSAGQATLTELEEFQCAGGGFAYWKGECSTVSPFLTAWVLHVLQRGQALGHAVRAPVLERGYTFLEGVLAQPRPENEGWWPAYTAWQSFAVKVLAEGGRNADSHLTRLFEHRDRMPVFALAFLRDTLHARGEGGERAADLDRRLGNAVLPEGGSAHVEELADPYLLWYWNSNVRSTAIVLGTIARAGVNPALAPEPGAADATPGPPGARTRREDPLLAGLVRWLMAARKQGRWGNTQENAWAMAALVDYYRKHEAEVPAFTGTAALAGQALMKEAFQGRTTDARAKDVPMAELSARVAPGQPAELRFEREGAGTLHYTARLRYVRDDPALAPLDQGMRITRRYALADLEGVAVTSAAAGALVKVTLELELTKERRFVAVTDPLPAGLEPVESWFATTASDLARAQGEQENAQWLDWWERGGFDHVERHDDRVQLFATRLEEGRHTFSYLARATTAGAFHAAPARAEEMYEPEVFGRTESAVLTVRP
jgi:hypothetical protein